MPGRLGRWRGCSQLGGRDGGGWCELVMPSGVALSRGWALGLGGVMDVSANPPPQAADQGVQLGPPGIRRSPRRRRPSGQPPPLPHHLQTTGVGWLTAAVVLVALSLLVFGGGLRGPAVTVTVVDDAVVRWLGGLQLPGLVGTMRAVARWGPGRRSTCCCGGCCSPCWSSGASGI